MCFLSDIWCQKTNWRSYLIRNPTSENQQWAKVSFSSGIGYHKTDLCATCYFYWKSNVWNSTLGNVFFSYEISHHHNSLTGKNDISPTFFFRRKPDVRNLMSCQHVFFIWTSNGLTQRVFSLEIQRQKPNIRPSFFFIQNLTSENCRQVNAFFFSSECHYWASVFLVTRVSDFVTYGIASVCPSVRTYVPTSIPLPMLFLSNHSSDLFDFLHEA